jgi:hypothetical protein
LPYAWPSRFCKICGIACNKRLGRKRTALRYALLALRPNPSRPAWVANPHIGLWRLSHYAASQARYHTRPSLRLVVACGLTIARSVADPPCMRHRSARLGRGRRASVVWGPLLATLVGVGGAELGICTAFHLWLVACPHPARDGSCLSLRLGLSPPIHISVTDWLLQRFAIAWPHCVVDPWKVAKCQA